MKAVEIRGLRKTYKGGHEAVKGIDLSVEQGDFFALLGPNGAGKSTTIGVIASLVNKTAGVVKIGGYDLDKDLEMAKSQLGLVPQEFNFNQFETVLQVVCNQAGYYGISRKLAIERAEIYLKPLDLWDKRHERGRHLSGGMKRRLMIARALIHQPQVLILDEPTAGVDIELRRSMWNFLSDINQQGTTIILTTHYLEEAEMLCRNIAIIDKGDIVEHTSMKKLLKKIDKETLILDLATNPASMDLEGYSFRLIDEHTIEVDVDKKQSINQLFKQLTQQGIEVMSLRNKSNRLEELFVELVKQNQTKDQGVLS